MAEEFQAGVCGSTWWNPARSSLGLSPCSAAINATGSFGWPSDLVGMKARSSTEESDSVSAGSMVFQDIQKPRQPDSGAGLLMNSTTDWNQTLLVSGRSESSNYHSSFLQEDMNNSSLNFRHETGMDCPEIQKEWSTMKNFSAAGGQDSTINEFKQTNQGFSLDQPTCQGLPTSFPMSPASYGYSSTLLQTLFDTDPQPQQSLFENRSMNYPATTNYQTNLNEFSPNSLAKLSPMLRPSLPKHQAISPLHLKNLTPFWNDPTAAISDNRGSFFPSAQAQFPPSTFKEELSCPNLTTKPNNEVVQDSCSMVKKSCGEPAIKRPRIETPSPLPTFKVRKEKLGDRITALQQLVSPFGKTDTASVLQEAIEYIKFLHDQVTGLSTPYMQNGAPIQLQQTSDKLKEPEGTKQDLRSRGLCLVPISSTFPVANETTADFWAPSFGGAFR